MGHSGKANTNSLQCSRFSTTVDKCWVLARTPLYNDSKTPNCENGKCTLYGLFLLLAFNRATCNIGWLNCMRSIRQTHTHTHLHTHTRTHSWSHRHERAPTTHSTAVLDPCYPELKIYGCDGRFKTRWICAQMQIGIMHNCMMYICKVYGIIVTMGNILVFELYGRICGNTYHKVTVCLWAYGCRARHVCGRSFGTHTSLTHALHAMKQTNGLSVFTMSTVCIALSWSCHEPFLHIYIHTHTLCGAVCCIHVH